MNFQPNAIYPNTLHHDRVISIPSVKLSADHMGEAVWRSSIAAGEPHPEERRDLIGTPPMFNYPTK